MARKEKKEWPLDHDLTKLMRAHNMFPQLRKIEQELTRMELKFGEDFMKEDGTVSMSSLRNWAIRAEGARMAFQCVLGMMNQVSKPSYLELKAIVGLGAKDRNCADKLIREDFEFIQVSKEPGKDRKSVQYTAQFVRRVTETVPDER